MNTSPNYIINIAFKLAKKNMLSGKGGPFGAVIVKHGEIIGKGFNVVTSSNDPTAHAEIMAIRDACKKLKTFQLNDCKIYSTSEPCPMCLGAIYWAKIKNINYALSRIDANDAGFNDSFIYSEFNLPFDKRKIPLYKYEDNEAHKIFKLWNDMENKILY